MIADQFEMLIHTSDVSVFPQMEEEVKVKMTNRCDRKYTQDVWTSRFGSSAQDVLLRKQNRAVRCQLEKCNCLCVWNEDQTLFLCDAASTDGVEMP